jgi:hypothetical protein
VHNYTENNTLTAQIQHLGAELISKKSNQGKEYIWEILNFGKTFSSFISIVGTKTILFIIMKKLPLV